MENPQDMDKQMGVMQESMLKMHEQMYKIMDVRIRRSASSSRKRIEKQCTRICRP